MISWNFFKSFPPVGGLDAFFVAAGSAAGGLGAEGSGTGCGPASAFSDVGKLGAAAVFSGEDVSELVASLLSTSGSWGSGPTALKRPMTVWNLEATKGLLARARVGSCWRLNVATVTIGNSEHRTTCKGCELCTV